MNTEDKCHTPGESDKLIMIHITKSKKTYNTNDFLGVQICTQNICYLGYATGYIQGKFVHTYTNLFSAFLLSFAFYGNI